MPDACMLEFFVFQLCRVCVETAAGIRKHVGAGKRGLQAFFLLEMRNSRNTLPDRNTRR